jgi:SAM-dependent methyltransferase
MFTKDSLMLKNYQKEFYQYQTKARDIISPEALIQAFNKFLPIYKKKIGSFLPKNLDAKILDLPCGYGNFSYYLLKSGYLNLDSIDLDINQVELARSIGINAQVYDGIDWLKKFPNTYDAIVSLDFLEHLDKDIAINYLHIIFNSLHEGGFFITRMPCADGPFSGRSIYNDITHEWAATSGVMRNLLMMVGLKDVNIFDDGPVPYKFINLIRLISFRLFCSISSFFLNFIGIGSPAIWTSNMWLIGKK